MAGVVRQEQKVCSGCRVGVRRQGKDQGYEDVAKEREAEREVAGGGVCSEGSRSGYRHRGCRWMTTWSPTRSHSAAAKAYIHRVQMDRQANTSRRGRSSGKDVKHCLFTLLPTQSHSQKHSKMSAMTEVKMHDV